MKVRLLMNKNYLSKSQDLTQISEIFGYDPIHPLVNPKNHIESLRVNRNELRTLPEGFASSTESAITNTLNIISILLDASGHPAAARVLGVITGIIGILWPGGSQKTWEEFMAAVEALIDEKITESFKNEAISKLNGLADLYTVYLSELELWLEHPHDPSIIQSVRTRFLDLDSEFISSMPQFAISGFEVSFLPVYAQAANPHLLLLRDLSYYGNDWGLQQPEIENYYNRQINNIQKYTDHCVKWYQLGLQDVYNKYNSTIINEDGGLPWTHYNRYRREMTILVLDLVATFSTNDWKKYYLETNVELSREIYTDPLGYEDSDEGNITDVDWYSEGVSFSTIENLHSPKLVEWLKRITIQTDYFSAGSDESYCWSGHYIYTTFTDSDKEYSRYYGNPENVESTTSYTFAPAEVYKVESVVGSERNATYDNYVNSANTFYQVTPTNELKKFIYSYRNDYDKKTLYSDDQLPLETDPPKYGEYSHRLSNITCAPLNSDDFGLVPILGWTHTSLKRENIIYPDKITQIPAVKSFSTEGTWERVAAGPGFTGGNVTQATNTVTSGIKTTDLVKIRVRIDSTASSKQYRVRLRYASNQDFSHAHFYTGTGSNETTFSLKKTTDFPFANYNSFGYVEIPRVLKFSSGSEIINVYVYPENGLKVQVDKIEFTPVDDNYEDRVTLEKAQKAVNTLFTVGRNALQTDVTDYKVDQVSILVDCVSEELYPNEKKELQNLVKYAKRLSISRNLLLDPNFTSINAPKIRGWHGSQGIFVGNGNYIFKGPYVHLQGTNDAQYPTYLYQKIDESKLKEYIRYKLRGFIESSQDLEVYVIRYDVKRETLDVSNNLSSDDTPANACGGPNRCIEQQYLDDNPTLECSSIQDGILFDSHSFSLNIDTGSIDYNENVGIWVVFKISTLEGYAKLGNVEVIEDGPLVGEALARVKRQETKWRNKLAQLRTETQAIYTRAKQSLDNLFIDAQDAHLKIGTPFAAIVAAREAVQSIREVYMPWLSVVAGVNYPIFTELNLRVRRALQLYDLRNVVRNGRFRNGLSNWNVTSDVEVQEENGNNVLVLSNWDAQVLQCIKLYQDRGYILRVTARKEGLGEGYITITDEEGNTDQLTFGSCEEIDASNSFVSTGYMTKELEFFPDTEKVRIEIGETEGTFKVESIELFLMEDLC
uniref:Crystaline entomocidal protoxin n=1 Tax=Bacillus thuringiensis TaxID=1428 RepID=A0A286JNW9_BACTU|nr:crystal protein cry7 [Bacillus thuringiensis]